MKWVKFIFTVSYPAISVNEYVAIYCLMLYILIVLPILASLKRHGMGDGGVQPHGDQ